MMSAPCSVRMELGGTGAQTSSHISTPNVQEGVRKSSLFDTVTCCPQMSTVPSDTSAPLWNQRFS